MTAGPDHVLHEILARGFRSYSQTSALGVAFAFFTAAFVWPKMPHGFVLAWLGIIGGLAVTRVLLARAFLGKPRLPAELARWGRYAAIAYGALGLAWGSLGAAAIILAPASIEILLVVLFLIAFFATLHAQVPAAYPPVFHAFLFCAMAPIIVVSALEPAPNYWLRLVGEIMVLVVSALVGRATHRYVSDSLAMRFENAELLRDLTRQKEELGKANAAKTHFLAAASHDLRQPMQAIVLLVESLQERVADPDTRRIVKNIRSSVGSMAALLNGILDISKFDAGTVKPERSHFPVAGLLDRLRTTYAGHAARSDLQLRVRRSSAVVETDPILSYRILANLASNALRYTDRGRVLVGCRRREDGVEIQVWDSGPGIAQSDLADIFQEFHQLGNPQRDRDQGLGLGLAIVQRTAKLLHHRVQVRSRVGHGSMFSITVPYGDAQAVRARAPARGADWASLEGCTVLVVEDERDIRAAMTILLESWGCEVMAASSGAEALHLLDNGASPPDAVLSDYRLPGEDNGIRVIHAVRERHPGAAGILISGDIAPAVLKEAEDSGFKLLHKPIRPARLRSLLGNMWRERSAAKRAGTEAQGALVP